MTKKRRRNKPKKWASLAEMLNTCLGTGTDKIAIGSSLSPGEEGVRAGDMRDVMKLVSGIRYLVKGWVPFGMLTMVLGVPGEGKSALVLYGLVRPIIVDDGLSWFNGLKGPDKPGYVLWCDTEGSAAITVQRITDWELPAERIKVPYEEDPLRSIRLTEEKDLQQIEAVINKYKIKLVVVDSLRGAHGGDENSSRVASVLQSLSGIAERTKAAIVVVHHTRKIQADEQISADSSRGSNAITAMVRSQLGIDRPDKTSPVRRLQMLKENLGLRPNPIGFTIGDKGLEFGEAPGKPRKETERSKAEDWLIEHMEPGKWYPAKELREEAAEAGFSTNAVQRAREQLGIVKPNIRKKKHGWEWRRLPSSEEK